MTRHIYHLFLPGLLLPILFSACNKSSNSSTTPAPILTIKSINPTHAAVGDTITITGTDFQSALLDKVSVNGKTATVISATATQLQITVPSLCGTGTITVAAGGNTVSGPIFTYDTTYALTTFATGLYLPQYLTMDAAGNLYVTNFGDHSVVKISSTGTVTTFLSGLLEPTGITIDGNNNLYIAINSPTNTSAILRATPAATVDTFAQFTGFVYGLTIDIGGNLYAANSILGGITKITSSGTATTFATGMPSISDIAVSNGGNLYATGQTNGSIYRITSTGVVTNIKSGFNFGQANGIVLDNNDDIFVTIIGVNPLGQLNTITEMDGSGNISTVTAGLDIPCGLIRDPGGNFYIVNQVTGNTSVGTIAKLTAL
jgi:hypothetical protein